MFWPCKVIFRLTFSDTNTIVLVVSTVFFIYYTVSRKHNGMHNFNTIHSNLPPDPLKTKWQSSTHTIFYLIRTHFSIIRLILTTLPKLFPTKLSCTFPTSAMSVTWHSYTYTTTQRPYCERSRVVCNRRGPHALWGSGIDSEQSFTNSNFTFVARNKVWALQFIRCYPTEVQMSF